MPSDGVISGGGSTWMWPAGTAGGASRSRCGTVAVMLGTPPRLGRRPGGQMRTWDLPQHGLWTRPTP
ncbi:hypothetical protein AFE02nite_26390 [Actinotalea fermentans]|uniref:Uncharacterized protein n=1 Tax=Actinotalea fermentans TaxID=43671 RepID=A0A511Z0D6_9CELL|nr:hypothetical protein AFE02nite_26390 [Actinotalea fermentans]